MSRKTILIAAVLLLSAFCSVWGQEPAKQPEHKTQQRGSQDDGKAGILHEGPPASALVKRGKTEFLERCSFCHGPDALGASGPNLARSSLVRKDVDGNLISSVIRNGRPEKGMPAFQLSESQIAAIVAFLHARSKEELFAFGMPEHYRFQTGNAAKGKAFFYGEGHCSSCHSPQGDLKGIVSKVPPLTLMELIAYPGRSAAPTATVITRSGKALSGSLVHLDEFSVSVRDGAGWVHTWNRKNVKLEIHDPLDEHKRLLREYTDEELHDLFAYLESLK